MSTQKIYQTVVDVARRRGSTNQDVAPYESHLDIGAGGGDLIEQFRREFGVRSWACDYTDQLIKRPGQKVEIADLNHNTLGKRKSDSAFKMATPEPI